ncbi:MAG: 16S rRNA (cytosine(1402)-N(4))-methyltransferase RsmH [bacterium]|nr:16S rRNA (cytosine(1402)-N(4))-methyltransferase RsmH [bacterium]MDZ4206079.1 16S rRNA (cytosine(1402)-N(4))-methyltransferase RsmH [Patescibacteria group bacterium]
MPNFATPFAQGYGGSRKASLDKHKPVLLHESIENLNLKPGKIFLDGTLGGGGHSAEVLRRFERKVRIIGLDQDPRAVESARELKIEAKKENFRNLDKVLEKLGISSVDAILFDLGISTDQLENSGKGFSFLKNEPLDMRMSNEDIRAADILNSWDEHAIELILRGFGEEKFSRKIARVIVERREVRPFQTTFELVEAILTVKPRSWRDKIHPATKTFQALRIATNEELTNLEKGLEKGFCALEPNGRLAVISFHSLEDRIVKHFFRDKIKEKSARQVTRKPITPKSEEIQANPRSRSAKLRVVEKV